MRTAPKKKMFALAAAVSIATLALAGCSSGSSTSGGKPQITIGVTVYAMSSFITQGQQGMNAYAAANNIKLDWTSANNDVSTQANQMNQLINAKVSAIIIVPVQADSLKPQVAAAKAAGIPVIEVNTALTSAAVDASVEPDDVAAGKQEATMMVKALGGKGNVVILQGPLGSSPEINRGKGIQEVLDQNPGIHVLAKDTANWDRTQAVTKTSNWVSAFGSKIDGVISQNDDMAIGAIKALQQGNLTGVKVVGIDGIQDGQVRRDDWDFAPARHGRTSDRSGRRGENRPQGEGRQEPDLHDAAGHLGQRRRSRQERRDRAERLRQEPAEARRLERYVREHRLRGPAGSGEVGAERTATFGWGLLEPHPPVHSQRKAS